MSPSQTSTSHRHRAPRYEGEDVSPTTARELKGFYAYGLAAEIFAVCGVGVFLLFPSTESLTKDLKDPFYQLL